MEENKEHTALQPVAGNWNRSIDTTGDVVKHLKRKCKVFMYVRWSRYKGDFFQAIKADVAYDLAQLDPDTPIRSSTDENGDLWIG